MGFLNKPRSNAGYKEFSIYNGRKIKKNESLDWAKSISEGTKKGRKENFATKKIDRKVADKPSFKKYFESYVDSII